MFLLLKNAAIGNTAKKKKKNLKLHMYGLFLRGTYSRVLKLKKRSNKLAIAVFLKNTAIGQL